MNSFGRLFRVSIFGESHGIQIGAVIDGCPAGISLSEKDLEHDFARRRAGGVGTTPRIEPDLPRIVSGVFNGKLPELLLLWCLKIQIQNQVIIQTCGINPSRSCRYTDNKIWWV